MNAEQRVPAKAEEIRKQRSEVDGPDEIRKQRSEKRNQKAPDSLLSVFSSLISALVPVRPLTSEFFLFCLLAVFSALACPLLRADGIPFVPQTQTVYEYGQTAIIRHAGGQEDLTIAAQFNTLSESLAWLIPLPAPPGVDSVQQELFERLYNHSAPFYRYSYGLGCGSSVVPLANGGDSTRGVSEIGHGLLGGYAWQVLEAFQPETLEDYLVQHGYYLPQGAHDAFQHYLDQGWYYFFVARIVDTNYYYNTPAVRLTFASDSIVYPLYISRLTSYSTEIILYVLADHRQMFHGGLLRFSGKISSDSFPELIDREYRLTKLTKTFSPAQMQDLTLRDAPDDQDYREVVVGGGVWFASFGLVFGAVFLTARRRRRGRKGGLRH